MIGTIPFFFTTVRIEQHLECASAHTRFFLIEKLIINELNLDKQT